MCSKMLLPALYSHLYLKSDSCWHLLQGQSTFSSIHSSLKPFSSYDFEVELDADRSIEVLTLIKLSKLKYSFISLF